MKKTLAFIAGITLWALNMCAQSVVSLVEEDGRYSIEAAVNGVGVKTYYTDENWFVSMSSTTYLFLYENGYIQDSDVRGLTTLKLPDGSSTKAASVLIKELKIEDHIIIKDLPAFVVKKQTVPLLIGSSAFESLGEVTKEDVRIIIGDVEENDPVDEAHDPIDELKDMAQAAIDSSDYAKADSCFALLKTHNALNMLTEYQYAMVLALQQKDKENIALSSGWLSEYEDKSLNMDYWMNNNLGASYARLKDNERAIESYEKAVESYYKLFNTSEKSIKKGDFHDETLGATLYSLGVVYANEGKVSKMESCFTLAAKCGNQSAIDFCKQYKIKY